METQTNKDMILADLMRQPLRFLQRLESASVMQVLQSENPSFALIRRQENGKTVCDALLSKLIIDFLNFLNLGKSMNESQVIETTKLILEDYSVLKPDDFVLFFNRAKKGHYGKAYDRMDGSVIFEWLEQYMYERDSEIEMLRRNEAKRQEKDIYLTEEEKNKAVPMPENVKTILHQLKTRKIENNPAFVLNQTEQQKQIQSAIYDFEQLAHEQMGKFIKGKPFVDIDGKKMDVQEYLEYVFSTKKLTTPKDI